MTTNARFTVDVTAADLDAFAQLSGDWNPLHTDATYAAQTPFKRPVLHGAFSAGLISRLAGMYLPGRNCLLHGMRLRFIAPIFPPARLVISGEIKPAGSALGRVDAMVMDAETMQRYVEASYDFSRREEGKDRNPDPGSLAENQTARAAGSTAVDAPVLVTGATGGIGSALLRRLGGRGLGVSRSAGAAGVYVDTLQDLPDALGDRTIRDVVHCAWPQPDNQDLLSLSDSATAIDRHIAAPLRDMLVLARVLAARGADDGMLVIIGSTFSSPGRHNYRLPLYSLGKSLVPPLVRILALELAATGRRVVAVVFDVIAGGMNSALSAPIQQAHADRTLQGRLPDPDETAAQIAWVLDNRSHLVSGATLVLSGGAIP